MSRPIHTALPRQRQCSSLGSLDMVHPCRCMNLVVSRHRSVTSLSDEPSGLRCDAGENWRVGAACLAPLLGPGPQIRNSRQQDVGIIAGTSQCQVAAMTKQPTDLACLMTMIDA